MVATVAMATEELMESALLQSSSSQQHITPSAYDEQELGPMSAHSPPCTSQCLLTITLP